MKKTLLGNFNSIKSEIENKEQMVIDCYLKNNTMPTTIYEIAGYKEIREKKITGVKVNSYTVCKKWIPSFKERPTKKDVEAIQEYNNIYSPNLNHIAFNYVYSESCGNCSGLDNLKDIIFNKHQSFHREELLPKLAEMKKLYEPKEGHFPCQYCGTQRLPEDLIQKTIFSPNWRSSGGKSPLRNYCKDKPCAGNDQMGHEG